MSFQQFRMAITSRINNVPITFTDEGNRFLAIAGGIKFLAVPSSRTITTRWGSGHQAQFTI